VDPCPIPHLWDTRLKGQLVIVPTQEIEHSVAGRNFGDRVGHDPVTEGYSVDVLQPSAWPRFFLAIS
jgi:hypothetical protein